MAQNEGKADLNQTGNPEERQISPWLEKRLLKNSVTLVHPVLPLDTSPRILPGRGSLPIGESGSRLTRQVVNRPELVAGSSENLALFKVVDTGNPGIYQTSTAWPALELLVSSQDGERNTPAAPPVSPFRAPSPTEVAKPRPPVIPPRPAASAPVMVRGKIEETATFPPGQPKENSRTTVEKPASPRVNITPSLPGTTPVDKPAVTAPSSVDGSQNRPLPKSTVEKVIPEHHESRSTPVVPTKSSVNQSGTANVTRESLAENKPVSKNKKTRNISGDGSEGPGKSMAGHPVSDIKPSVKRISRKPLSSPQTDKIPGKRARQGKAARQDNIENISPVTPAPRVSNVTADTGTPGFTRVSAKLAPAKPEVESLPENTAGVRASNPVLTSPPATQALPLAYTQPEKAVSFKGLSTGQTGETTSNAPLRGHDTNTVNEGPGRSPFPLPVSQVHLPEPANKPDLEQDTKPENNVSYNNPAAPAGTEIWNTPAVRDISHTTDNVVHRSVTAKTLLPGTGRPNSTVYPVHNVQPVINDRLESRPASENISTGGFSQSTENSRIDISTGTANRSLNKREDNNESSTPTVPPPGSSFRPANLTVQRSTPPSDLPRKQETAEHIIRIPAAGIPSALDLPVARTARPGLNEGVTHRDGLFKQKPGKPTPSPLVEHHLPGMASSTTGISRVPQHVASTATSPAASAPASTGGSTHDSMAAPRPAASPRTPDAASQEDERNTNPDLKALARELYPLIRRMLIIEKERLPHF